MAAEIDYPNFKSEVARRQGHGRAGVYGEVWATLLGRTLRKARTGRHGFAA